LARSSSDLLSREEILGGLPSKRQQNLLFVVEAATARVVAEARLPAELVTGQAADELEDAFFQAFKFGTALPLEPSIHDLELHASRWAPLVPENPQARAGLARLLGQKYRFAEHDVPRLRRAVGIDDPAVQAAYETLYAEPIQGIFAPRISPADRMRWLGTGLARWLDSLPPFWYVAVLVCTMSVPQAILALPIALAGIGPVTGVLLLAVFGLVNTITIACLAEAYGRNGPVQYGAAFLGRVVSDYLGRTGSVVMSAVALFRAVLFILACLIGLASTLAAFTPLPSIGWTIALFLLGLWLCADRSVNLSTAAAVLLGAASLSLALVLALLALGHAGGLAQFSLDPFTLLGGALSREQLGLVFGSVLGMYAVQTFLPHFAKLTLPRDPSGASLIKGSMAGTLIITAIYSVWVLGIDGGIAPSRLLGESSTVLLPLARELGPFASAVGMVLLLLLLGLAFIRMVSLAFNLMRDWLPHTTSRHEKTVWYQPHVRFWFSVSPLVLSALLAVWLDMTGSGSFTAVFSLNGMLGAPLVAGLFPLLLLVSSRRKGDAVPAGTFRALGHPLVLAALFVFFEGILLAHGLFIWQGAGERTAALLDALLMVVLPVLLARQGAFTSRLVVELRDDARPERQAMFHITAAGARLPVNVRLAAATGERQLESSGGELPDLDSLKLAEFQLPASSARELKVWVHRVTADGASEALPATVDVKDAGNTRKHHLAGSRGQLRLPITGGPCLVTITL